MLKLFLWLKYLRRRRIVFLSIAAVALSVSLLIVVASLFTGFIHAFERSAVEMLGDVIVGPPPGGVFEKYPLFVRRLEEADFVEAASGTLSTVGLLHVGRGNVRPVSIWGIEPERHFRVCGSRDSLLRQRTSSQPVAFAVPGHPGEPGGFVGIGVVADADPQTDRYDQASIMAEMIGQRLAITTGTVDIDPNGNETPKRELIPFYVSDIVFAGVHDLDSMFVYISIEELQEIMHPDLEAPAGTINVKLKPGVDPELAVAQIRGLWQVFATDELGWKSWQVDMTTITTALEMQHQYIVELRKQMGVLLLIFGVVSFSVVVLVFCIFYMIVQLKRRDVAIIKSCGAGSLSVAWIFLGFGVTVGVVGAGIGAVLGYVVTTNINAIEDGIRAMFGLKLWSSSVYMFDKIPNEVDWASSLPIIALAIGAAAVGALTPAIVAALTKPVEVLRYE